MTETCCGKQSVFGLWLKDFLRYWYVAAMFIPLWIGGVVYLYWTVIDWSRPVWVPRAGVLLDDDGIVDRVDGLEVRRTICATHPITVTIYRSFVDGLIYEMPPDRRLIPQGCTATTGKVELPPGLPPGKLAYRVSISVPINPVRSVSIDLPDIVFTLRDPAWHGSVSADHNANVDGDKSLP
jgi:hypothetical protein